MGQFDSPEMLEAMSALEKNDYLTAFRLFKPLAEAGNPKAQCNLAALYQVGAGVETNQQIAIELYSRVAERQIMEEHLSAIAYNNLATIYSLTNPQKAAEYQRQAKAMGFDIATSQIEGDETNA
jgi:TPR repeat protein